MAANGAGLTDINGAISFNLGLGLEYVKKSSQVNSYVKGVTGTRLSFSANTNSKFSASIGFVTCVH